MSILNDTVVKVAAAVLSAAILALGSWLYDRYRRKRKSRQPVVIQPPREYSIKLSFDVIYQAYLRILAVFLLFNFMFTSTTKWAFRGERTWEHVTGWIFALVLASVLCSIFKSELGFTRDSGFGRTYLRRIMYTISIVWWIGTFSYFAISIYSDPLTVAARHAYEMSRIPLPDRIQEIEELESRLTSLRASTRQSTTLP